MRRILISNDDGIYGMGLKPLIRALRPMGNLLVIVPDGERSAARHSLTKKDVIGAYITNGTPSDCVRFGLLELLKKKKVDLVVGGINHGPNLGEDIIYSGTVAIAREAAMMGIPAMAVSMVNAARTDHKFVERKVEKLARLILKYGLPNRVFLNVNFPANPGRRTDFEVTRLGRRVYGKVIPSGVDPRGQLYYWLAGDIPKGIPEPGTDMAAIKARKISITPLSVDSANALLTDLSRWRL